MIEKPAGSETLAPSPAGTAAPPQVASDLATLLSRLAARHGHAVSAFRFGMLQHGVDGVEIGTLPAHQQGIEMWRARFAQARVRTLELDQTSRGDFPLLWVSSTGGPPLMLMGRLSHGAFVTENVQGVREQIAPAELGAGHLLALEPAQADSAAAAPPAPKSATEWFAFALRKQRRIFVDAVFATFVVSAIGLVTSLYSMQVYDRVLPTKGYSTLWVLTAGVLLATVLELVLKHVRSSLVDRASKVIDQELSSVFFAKALDIRMDARPPTVGTFASQIRHFESVRNFMTSSTLFVLADAPFALFFIVVIGLLGGPVALVPLITVPLAVITGLLAGRAVEGLTADHMRESNIKNGLLIEAIDGIESIKAAGGEWKMLDRYRDLTARMASTELQQKELSTGATYMAQTIQQLNYIGMVATGAWAISSGSLTMGGLVACSIISGRALSPLAQIPSLLVQWKNAKIALKALDAIMAMPSDRDADTRLVVPQSCSGTLRLEKVAFGYSPAKPALEIAELIVKPGERVAILGSVGSGKTTLIKLLSGLYKPRTGSVFLDSVDISHLAPEFVREQIGYLPQDVRLFNGTLRENLTLGLPTPADALILRACSLTGLDQVIQNHPKGLELEITEGGRGLSGGQRQLVGLTRLLLAQPRVMLLDEPTASMDAQLEARVMRHLFNEIPPQSTLLVVTHKTALLAHVNRIIIVEQGKIIIDGPRDAILAKMQQMGAIAQAPQKSAASEVPAPPAQSGLTREPA